MNISALPSELILITLANLEPRQLLNLCETNKYYRNICNNENFWQSLVQRDFGPVYKYGSWYQTYKRFHQQLPLLKMLQEILCYTRNEYIRITGHDPVHLGNTFKNYGIQISPNCIITAYYILTPNIIQKIIPAITNQLVVPVGHTTRFPNERAYRQAYNSIFDKYSYPRFYPN